MHEISQHNLLQESKAGHKRCGYPIFVKHLPCPSWKLVDDPQNRCHKYRQGVELKRSARPAIRHQMVTSDSATRFLFPRTADRIGMKDDVTQLASILNMFTVLYVLEHGHRLSMSTTF